MKALKKSTAQKNCTKNPFIVYIFKTNHQILNINHNP